MRAGAEDVLDELVELGPSTAVPLTVSGPPSPQDVLDELVELGPVPAAVLQLPRSSEDVLDELVELPPRGDGGAV